MQAGATEIRGQRRSSLEKLPDKLGNTVKPLIPPALRREVKRRISRRYRYFDRDRHRPPVGRVEEWEEHGNSQFDYLVEHGLRPHHYLLDIGCGPLTAGIRFIRNPRHEKMLVFTSEP